MTICRSCESDDLEKILDLGDQPWGNDFRVIGTPERVPTYPLELFFCNTCKLVQIGYTVPKETMFVDHTYLSGTTRTLKNHFANVVNDVLERTSLDERSLVLDVGGNDGTFLEFFGQRGIPVLNVDSGRLQAEESQKKGVPCINAFFNEKTASRILDTHGKPQVVHGSGIFFHLEELHSVFSGIRNIISNDGVLVAEFIYLPEMVRRFAFDQIYHEHLVYYSLSTFSRVISRHGFSLTDAWMASIHGGSCIAFAVPAESTPSSTRLQEYLAQEIDDGFESVEVFVDFARNVETVREKLVRLVRRLRQGGNSIQALGAPVKGSTLINYCGLTEDDVECAVEINPHKCGSLIPGTRIPVYHENAVRRPDVYLLLAWNFMESILENLKAFRDAGGKVIVPFPDPHVI